jgi:lipopolysaccharide/colanic/teichoic acid biosynthesis glycosyltransferase
LTDRLDEWIKRTLDVVLAFALLAMLSPLMVLVALLVRAESAGPVLFRQARVGRGRRPFWIYKFRTMVQDAESRGPMVTSADDPRMTRVGKKLRAWKLDELPQLFNVLRGDMSLVGPRPQVPRYVDRFPDAMRDIILSVRPGITGPAAVKFRHEEEILQARPDREEYYIDVLMPIKCELDVEYVRSRSLALDARVLWDTGLILGRGVVNRLRRRPLGMDIEHEIPLVAPVREPALEALVAVEERVAQSR